MKELYNNELLEAGFTQKKVGKVEFYEYETALICPLSQNLVTVACTLQNNGATFSNNSLIEYCEGMLYKEKYADFEAKYKKSKFTLDGGVLKMKVNTSENVYIELDAFIREYLRIEQYFEKM